MPNYYAPPARPNQYANPIADAIGNLGQSIAGGLRERRAKQEQERKEAEQKAEQKRQEEFQRRTFEFEMEQNGAQRASAPPQQGSQIAQAARGVFTGAPGSLPTDVPQLVFGDMPGIRAATDPYGQKWIMPDKELEAKRERALREGEKRQEDERAIREAFITATGSEPPAGMDANAMRDAVARAGYEDRQREIRERNEDRAIRAASRNEQKQEKADTETALSRLDRIIGGITRSNPNGLDSLSESQIRQGIAGNLTARDRSLGITEDAVVDALVDRGIAGSSLSPRRPGASTDVNALTRQILQDNTDKKLGFDPDGARRQIDIVSAGDPNLRAALMARFQSAFAQDSTERANRKKNR